MNDTMRFFTKQADKVYRVVNKIKHLLLSDEHIVIHPTVVTIDLINSFKRNTAYSDVLEISNIFRVTKDITGTPVVYFVIIQKRYGRTYKPKYFYLLDNHMYTICRYEFTDRITDIATSVAQQINYRL